MNSRDDFGTILKSFLCMRISAYERIVSASPCAWNRWSFARRFRSNIIGKLILSDSVSVVSAPGHYLLEWLSLNEKSEIRLLVDAFWLTSMRPEVHKFPRHLVKSLTQAHDQLWTRSGRPGLFLTGQQKNRRGQAELEEAHLVSPKALRVHFSETDMLEPFRRFLRRFHWFLSEAQCLRSTVMICSRIAILGSDGTGKT
jgi:hypothetical protein